jgi:hypothetical protein
MSKVPLRPVQLDALVKDHPAAALLWLDIDALLTLRMYYAFDCCMEAATIVSYVLAQHQRRGELDGWIELSVDKLLKTIPSNLFARATVHRACQDMVDLGVLETKPVVRNTARKFRVVPDHLIELLANVDANSPGLTAIASNAGLGTINRAKSMKSVDAVDAMESEK